MSQAPLVRFADVSKTFPGPGRRDDRRVAVQHFDARIAEGEFVSLLGPSGCGKSTLLRIVAGLTLPSSGAIERAWADDRRRSREVACVFQEPTLMPWARVWDNVYLPRRLAGDSRRDAADDIAEALERVGLSGSERSYPHQLSGGMKMRVSIARALVTRPRLLLLDEPFAALDEITRGRLNDDLLALAAERGFAVLFITHSVYESVYLSDRVLVMTSSPGRLAGETRIDLPKPREEAVRGSARYGELCGEVSRLLREGMGRNDQ